MDRSILLILFVTLLSGFIVQNYIVKVPKEEINRNVPKEEINRNVPKEEINRNVPKEEINRNVPKKEINRNVPKKEINRNVPKKPKEPKFGIINAKHKKMVNESVTQFMLRWMEKSDNIMIPEVIGQSDDTIIGDLYSRFRNTTQMANFALEPTIRKDEIKPLTVDHMWFQVTGRSVGLLHSELKFYRDCSNTDKYHSRAVNVTVYRVNNKNQLYDQLVFVNSTVLPAFESGWFSVHMTDCYRYWIDFPKKNEGIRVVTRFVEQPNAKVSPELIGIVGFDREIQKHAFLINFFDQSKDTEEYFDEFFWRQVKFWNK